MTDCTHSRYFFRNRKARRERVLRKMASMRAAKARKRLENLPAREPHLIPLFPLQIGVRDKRTGEIAWVDFRSVRDATRRLAVVKKLYK